MPQGDLVIVLARPQIGENVGAAARAMLNFGLAQLRLVRPECGWPNAKAVAMASGAVQVLNDLTVHDTLEQALADCHHVLATTARSREMAKPVVGGRAALAEARGLVAAGRRVAFVFGAERTGLANAELLLADRLVTFPTSKGFSSLNLAQAVLLVAYEWQMAGDPAAPLEPVREAATKGQLDHLVRTLLTELDAADYFKSETSRVSLSGAIANMIERRGWTAPETNLMHGVIRELVAGNRRRTP